MAFFSAKSKLLSMSPPWQAESTVSRSTSCCSLKGDKLLRGEPVVENAKREPHFPWFFTSVTAPIVVQSTVSTSGSPTHFHKLLGLYPVYRDTKPTGCQVNKLIDLQLVREILVNCGVDKSTRPLENWKRGYGKLDARHKSTGQQTRTSQLSKQKILQSPRLLVPNFFVQGRFRGDQNAPLIIRLCAAIDDLRANHLQ